MVHLEGVNTWVGNPYSLPPPSKAALEALRSAPWHANRPPPPAEGLIVPASEIPREWPRDGKTQKSLLTTITDRYERCREMKASLHDKWWTMLAFVNGRQYVRYVGGNPIEPKAPSWRVRLTHNTLRPIVNTWTAKLTQNRPGVMTLPSGPEEWRVLKAKATDYLYEYLHEACSVQRELHAAVWWAGVTGAGALSWGWNPYAGRTYELTGDQGDKTFARSGLPSVTAWSPFDVYPDWHATDLTLDKCRWVIRVHMLTGEDVKQQLREAKIEGLKAGGDGDSRWAGSDDNYESALRRDITGYSDVEDSNPQLFKVFEYEEAPSREWPDGRRIVCTSTQILDAGPLMGGDYSLSLIKANPSGGRMFPNGLVDDNMDLQRELNRTISQAVEFRNRYLGGQWVAAKGTLDTVPSNQPDELIEYNAHVGPRPHRVDPPQMPSNLWEMVDQLKRAMMDNSGVHEISQGSAPTGVVSGRALATLSDQDQQKLGPVVEQIERACTQMARGLVWLWKTYCNVEITTAILGRSRQPEVIRLHSSMIDSTDIKVLPDSMMPRRPSIMREQIMNLATVGLLGDYQSDPRIRMRIQKLIGHYGFEFLADDDSPDRNYARQENDILANGEWPQVSWYEDHTTHVDEHIAFMLSPEYRDLGDESKRMLEYHLALHYQELAKQGAGQATYAHVLGMDPAGGQPPPQDPMQGQQQPLMLGPGGEAQQPLDMGASNPSQQMGAYDAFGPEPGQMGGMGGGTPELNGAHNPNGPGVNGFEESFGQVPQ